MVPSDSEGGTHSPNVYAELVEAIQQSSVVPADETDWRIGTLVTSRIPKLTDWYNSNILPPESS